MAAEELDLRTQLQNAYRDSVTDESDKVEAPPDKPAAEIKPVGDERPRDERGRFVSGVEKVEATPEPAIVEPKQPAIVDPAKVAPVETKPAALAPPNGWSAEAKAKWHELPPEIQAAVNQREHDVAKFTSKTDEERAFGREMHRVVSPYLAQIQAEGGTPAGAVQSLLNTAYILRNGTPEQKQQALIGVAQQFNIELPNPEQQQQIPPELGALYQRINQLEGSLQQQYQSSVQATQASVHADIDRFAADPAHPHFEAVKAVMGALMSSGQAQDLQTAYDMACHARPDIRATLSAQARAEEEQKRRAEETARAAAARSKAVSITGGPGIAASSAPADRSLRDELAANYRAASGLV